MFASSPGGIRLRPTRTSAALTVLVLMVASLAAVGLLVPSVAASSSGPSVTAAQFMDRDGDGHLDAIKLSFSQADNMNDLPLRSSIRPSDFLIGGIPATGCIMEVLVDDVFCGAKAVVGVDSNRGATAEVTLTFPELVSFGDAPSVLPQLTYSNGVVRDKDRDTMANILAADVSESVENYPPRLVRVFPAGTKSLVYHFTEKTFISTSPPTNDAKNSVCWLDVVPGTTVVSVESFVPSSTTPSAQVTLTAPPDGNDRAKGFKPSLGTQLQPSGECNENSSALVDSAGTLISNPSIELPWNQTPTDLKVLTSIGSNKAVLVFDGPVESATGTALALSAFDYEDVGGTVGASGISAVSHVAGSERVLLTLNNRVSSADILSDQIIIKSGAVRGAGTTTTAILTGVHKVPLDDRLETFANTEVDKVRAMFLGVDQAPVVEEVATIDRDNNGVLDAVRVRYDQSVTADGTTASSFKLQLRNADKTAATTAFDVTNVVDFGDAPSASCPMPTGLDARYVFVCFTPVASVGTGATLELSSSGIGIKEVLKSPSGSEQSARPFTLVPALDFAAPTVLGVHTGDVGSNPLDPKPDGRLDSIVLTMSEAVQDGNIASAGFMIRDGAGGTAVAATGGKYVAPKAPNTSPHLLYVMFPAGSSPDTDHTPVISYDASAGGVKDLAGRSMVAFGFNDVTGPTRLPHATVDKAAPIVVSMLGSTGTSSAVMTLSEPIQLVSASDFSYSNTNNQGAQGISSVSHTAGSKTVTIGLVGSLVDSDLTTGGDSVNIRVGSGGSTTSTVKDLEGNFVKPGAYALTAGAGVQILSVETLDLFDNPTSAAGQSKAANGRIDTLRVTLSQAVDDGSGSTCSNLDLGDWSISVGTDEHEVLFGETDIQLSNEPSVSDTWTTGSCASRAAARDDAVVYLIFDEDGPLNDKPWSTAVVPKLKYINDGDSNFLASLNGGVPVGSSGEIQSVDKAMPLLLVASGSPGSAAVSLRFSEEVLSANPNDNRITTSDLDYLNVNTQTSNGEGASNIKSVGIRSGATQPITLNAPLHASDIGTDKIAVLGTLKDASGNLLRKNSFTGAALPDVAISDGAPPTVASIHTLDTDGNGLLDHVRVTFSENIDDGTGATCDNLEAADWKLTYLDQPAKIVSIKSHLVGTTCNDDARIFFELDEDDVLTDIAAHQNGLTLGTGKAVKVAYAPNSNSLQIKDRASPANVMAAFTAQTSQDGAAPRLLTADGGPINTAPAANPVIYPEAAFRDLNGDGRLDAVELVFSEPMDDSTFDPAEWTIVNHAKRDGGFSTGATINDERVLILITQLGTANTDKVYRVTYDPVAPGVKDLAGNELAALIGSDAIAEVDRARPNLDIGVSPNPDAVPGRNDVNIVFSEPVGASGSTPGAPLALTAADFSYQNGNTGANDRAAAIVSVTHVAGSASVKLVLDATLSQEDIDNDVIVLKSIHDLVGNKATRPSFKLSGAPSDTTPPLDVSSLTATGIEVSATTGNVKLSWTTSGDTDLASLRIYIREGSAIDANNPDGQTGTHLVTAGAIGDSATPPAPIRNTAQSLTVTGLPVDKTYHFLVVSVDTAGLPSDGVAASAKVNPKDTVNPSAVTDLVLVTAGGNSVTLQLTVPTDNVAVTAFEVRHKLGTTLAVFTEGEVGTFTMTDTLGNVITTVPAAGTKVNVVVSGLLPAKEYTFGVRAKDAAGLTGTPGTVTATTAAPDTTPPVGELLVTSPTHAAGVGSTSRSPTFSWSGLTDGESTITYYYALNQISTYEVDGTEVQGTRSGSVVAETVSFTDVDAGTWYFHVRGESQGGFHGTTAHYPILITDPDVVLPDSEDIKDGNEALQKTVSVTRSGSDNILRWTLPTTDLDIAGLQIWRSTSPYTLLVDLPATHVDFISGEFVDKGAPETAKYLVTLYFLTDAAGGQVDDVDNAPGYEGKTSDELDALAVKPTGSVGNPPATAGGDGMPWWVWLLVAIGVIGIVAVVVIPVALSRRGKQEAGWDESAQWDDSAWGTDPWVAGADVDTDSGADTAHAEEHYIECPKCDHGFEAHGAKPLQTTCPNCGVKGILR